jgi:NADH-quinone oxidoreductase subunit G
MVDTRDDVVVRLRPRPNLDVNRHFICDHGRMDYRWMNRGDRMEAPLVREGDRLVATDWDTAAGRLAGLVRDAGGSVVLLASGRASLESLGWLSRLAGGRPAAAAIRVPRGGEAPLAGIPGLALRAERVPNLDGARLAGFGADFDAALAAAATAALVIVLDLELDDELLRRLAGARGIVVIGTVDDDRLAAAASVLLPCTSMVEENGTYVNRDGRVQRFFQARGAPGMARPAWWIAAQALAAAGGGDPPATAADAFAALGSGIPALAGLTYGALGLTGYVLEAAPAGAAR